MPTSGGLDVSKQISLLVARGRVDMSERSHFRIQESAQPVLRLRWRWRYDCISRRLLAPETCSTPGHEVTRASCRLSLDRLQ